MIFIRNRLDWIVRLYYRLDCLSISIAKFYIDWIGLDWQPWVREREKVGKPCSSWSTSTYPADLPEFIYYFVRGLQPSF